MKISSIASLLIVSVILASSVGCKKKLQKTTPLPGRTAGMVGEGEPSGLIDPGDPLDTGDPGDIAGLIQEKLEKTVMAEPQKPPEKPAVMAEISGLPATGADLFGRDRELKMMDDF